MRAVEHVISPRAAYEESAVRSVYQKVQAEFDGWVGRVS